MGQPGFFDLSRRYEGLNAAGDPLVAIAAAVPFELFRGKLQRALVKGGLRKADGDRKSAAGRKPWDEVLIFKILVLQALYNLSDDAMEYQLRDRLSFMCFAGLGLENAVPDAKTLWLYREALTQAKAVDKLFHLFDNYLKDQGYLAKPFELRRAKRAASIIFGPSEAEQEHGFAIGTMSDGMSALIFSGPMRIAPLTESEKKERENSAHGEYILSPISDQRKAAVTELFIGRPLSTPVILKLGAMDKPLAVLSTCLDELMTHWGIDAEKHRNLTLAARPDGNPGRWINAADYRSEMFAKGNEAIVHFRLSVDEHGNATACHIQQSTRPKAFDNVVCRVLMKRAKFLPAVDKAGTPITSYYRNTARFIIP